MDTAIPKAPIGWRWGEIHLAFERPEDAGRAVFHLLPKSAFGHTPRTSHGARIDVRTRCGLNVREASLRPMENEYCPDCRRDARPN